MLVIRTLSAYRFSRKIGLRLAIQLYVRTMPAVPVKSALRNFASDPQRTGFETTIRRLVSRLQGRIVLGEGVLVSAFNSGALHYRNLKDSGVRDFTLVMRSCIQLPNGLSGIAGCLGRWQADLFQKGRREDAPSGRDHWPDPSSRVSARIPVGQFLPQRIGRHRCLGRACDSGAPVSHHGLRTHGNFPGNLRLMAAC